MVCLFIILNSCFEVEPLILSYFLKRIIVVSSSYTISMLMLLWRDVYDWNMERKSEN